MDNQTHSIEGVTTAASGGLAAMQGNLDTVAKYVLYAIAVFLPLWFLPSQVGIEFGREVTFTVLTILAGILWLLSVLTSGEIRFQHSAALWVGGALLVVWGLSTAFSVSWVTSLITSEAISEKVTTFAGGFLLMLLLGGLLRSRADAMMVLFLVVVAGGVGALFTAIQLLTGQSVWGLLADFAKDRNFTVVGTLNGLALFYAALLGVAAGMIVSLKLEEWKVWFRWALYAATAFLALDVILINYRYSWIVLIGVATVLFGLTFRHVKGARAPDSPRTAGLDWRYLVAIIFLVLSIFMYMFQPTVWTLDLPQEVSPSFRTTWNIGKAVLAESPQRALLGSGPGTFGLEWLKYKDPQVNLTQFWGVRFNQGFSWVSTLVATTGVVGTALFVLFIVGCFFVFARAVAGKREAGAEEWARLGVGPLVGLAAVAVAAVLYPANSSLVILFFLLAGVASYVLSDKRPREEVAAGGGIAARLHDFSERTVRFDSQWAVFISSLVSVFLLALGVAGIYYELNRVRAAQAAQAGLLALNSGNLTDAVAHLSAAITAEPKNTNYANTLVQARVQRVSALIQRASRGENVQVEFQQEVNSADGEIGNAIAVMPLEPNLYRTRGALYELIIPFIPGAANQSLDAYRRAIEMGPRNPAAYVDFARAGLTFVDNVQILAAQVSAEDRAALFQARDRVLQETKSVLEKGITVKPDFAAAHFLLSQAAIRLGDIQTAIRSTENAKLTAPLDIGVAFQLGLLYYQAGNLNASQAEFERAVGQQTNYSNARYFLGLIYDRKGQKEAAIEQFVKIEELNPDNQEVKKILENLRAGKSALSGIVPPATPPEDRREPPVGGGN